MIFDTPTLYMFRWVYCFYWWLQALQSNPIKRKFQNNFLKMEVCCFIIRIERECTIDIQELKSKKGIERPELLLQSIKNSSRINVKGFDVY